MYGDVNVFCQCFGLFRLRANQPRMVNSDVFLALKINLFGNSGLKSKRIIYGIMTQLL